MNPQGELVDEDCGANCYAAFPHPYSQFSDPALLAAFPEYQGESFAYKPYNNVGPFFRKGLVSNSNINISGGTEDVNLNLSVGHADEEGFTRETA
ncbi:MAG: hypothetical protein U5K69_06150 [Balneolaceae bacterium]|nr:hypothetical protein [Balneolaceae bacterium]